MVIFKLIGIYLLVGIVLFLVAELYGLINWKKRFEPKSLGWTLLIGLAGMFLWFPLLVLFLIAWITDRSLVPKQHHYDGQPLVILRNHPDYPGTLPWRLNGRWVKCQKVGPGLTVEEILDQLNPSCYVDWQASMPRDWEHQYGYRGVVVLVRPGERQHPRMSSPPGRALFDYSKVVHKKDVEI